MTLKIIENPIEFKSRARWNKDKVGSFNTTHYQKRIPFSCPPEFGGIKNPSPEDLFISSIATCTLTTILHLCDSLRAELDELAVEINAEVVYSKDNGYVFSKILCKIEVMGEDEFLLKRACKLAPDYCLIGRSIIPKIEYSFDVKERK